MLNPRTLVDAVAAAFGTITTLVQAMNNDPTNIIAYHYNYANDPRLVLAIEEMKAPSILVYWQGTQGGNFSGQQIWKHRLEAVIRAGNTTGTTPLSYEDIWFAMMQEPCNGTSLNFRNQEIIPGVVDLVDTPSIKHHTDSENMDMFTVELVFPEIGDH